MRSEQGRSEDYADGAATKPRSDLSAEMGATIPEVVSLNTPQKAWDRFDLAMKGIPDDRRSEIMRIMSNLRLSPDDPSAILLAVSGRVEALAAAIQVDFDEMLDDARRSLSAGVMKDFSTMESTIMKRIAAMEESAIVVSEAAISLAAESAADVVNDKLSKDAELQINKVATALNAQIEDVRNNVKSSIDRAISQRVKAESKKAIDSSKKEVLELKSFVSGLLLGLFSAAVLFALAVFLAGQSKP